MSTRQILFTVAGKTIMRKEVIKMTAASSGKLEQLRQAVLGNQRGREVEVEPTGEIRVAGDVDNGNQDFSNERPTKPSKMSSHTFGA